MATLVMFESVGCGVGSVSAALPWLAPGTALHVSGMPGLDALVPGVHAPRRAAPLASARDCALSTSPVAVPQERKRSPST